MLTIILWIVYSSSPKYLLSKGFANPLLSVAGQRLVLNLRAGSALQTDKQEDLFLIAVSTPCTSVRMVGPSTSTFHYPLSVTRDVQDEKCSSRYTNRQESGRPID